MIEIIDYQAEHQPQFESLNRSWLERFFVMEPVDTDTLTKPDKHILAEGGKILMALQDDQLAGTVALKRLPDGNIELTKMAVDEPYQRKGIAEALCRASFTKAREMGADRLVLYSSTVLEGAIELYRKLGFTEIPLEDGVYKRADIKMERMLVPINREERQKLIQKYGSVYEPLKSFLDAIPEKAWKWRPPSGKWTIHEYLVHLADSEANSYVRCRKFIAEPGGTIAAYNQDAWKDALHYHEQSALGALELFKNLRQSSYHLIKDLPDEIWEHTLFHPESGPMTMTDWLYIYAYHTHLGHMKRNYATFALL